MAEKGPQGPGSRSRFLRHPEPLQLFPNCPWKASSWDPEVAPGGTHAAAAGVPGPGHQGFLTLGSGGHGGGGIPTPPRQFVHFLPWMQISTISFVGHLRPLLPPGPTLTLAATGRVLSCQLEVWNQLCPQASTLPRGCWMPGGALGQRAEATRVQVPLCSPHVCLSQQQTHGAYCAPE